METQKIDFLSELLKEYARAGKPITYGEIARPLGLNLNSQDDRNEIGRYLERISKNEHAEGRPLLSVLVVGKSTAYPSYGFFTLGRELGVYDGAVFPANCRKPISTITDACKLNKPMRGACRRWQSWRACDKRIYVT